MLRIRTYLGNIPFAYSNLSIHQIKSRLNLKIRTAAFKNTLICIEIFCPDCNSFMNGYFYLLFMIMRLLLKFSS